VVHFQGRRRSRDLWGAVSRLTRPVLGFFLGGRGLTSLHALGQPVPRAYRRQPIDPDFAAWQHRPRPAGSGRTSVAEGLNNQWRSRIAGLVRRTVRVRAEADLVQRLERVVHFT